MDYPVFRLKTTLFIRHVLYIGLIAVFVGCASATTEITATPPDAAKVGRALDEGNYRGAILYLEQSGISALADLPLLMLTARAYKAGSDDVKHYSAIQRILEIDPYNAFGLEQMGLISLSREDLETAEKFLTLAVSVEAERWMSWNGLGIIADADARHEQAREYFNKALEIMPGHPKVLANLGWSRLLDNDYEEAELLLQQSVEVAPESRTTLSNLALSIALQGRYEESMSLYEQLYDKAVAANNVGYAARMREDLEAADKYLAMAIELDPDYFKRAGNNLIKRD